MSDKPVVVYGASGYTGRLICEYLREYNVPFVAAGRDGGKLKASMESNVAGIETADYEVVEVTHDVESLTELFSGASVVLQHRRTVQQVGPGGRRGVPRRRRALHDTTGEQDWLITCDEEYGADFAAAGLLLSPGIAQMYTTGEIAAELALETARSRHPRHRRVLGRQPDDRLDADDPVQRGTVRRALPRAERLRPVRPGGRPLPARHPGPARARARAAVGRHVAPGLVPQGPAGRELQGARRGVQQGADARRTPDRRGRARGDQGHGARREVRRPRRPPRRR